MNRWQGNAGGMRFGGIGLTPAVKGLLIANVAIFFLQNLVQTGAGSFHGPLVDWGSFVPYFAVNKLQVWRFFTYMFLHGDFWHIAFNMFGLWMFGSQIEALWGSRSFLIYYLVCGLGGAVLYGIFNLAGISALTPMLGASAAVFGILLAYGLTFPDNVILVMMIIPMKAKYAVMLFGLIELMSIPRGSGVAHLAHLGGMAAGYLFLRFTTPNVARRSLGGGGGLGEAWRRFQRKRNIKIVKPDGRGGGNGSARRGTGPGAGRSPEQQKVDAILDKISREGLQSLSDEEQEILRRAGRK